jgi:hypothetical protein
MFSEENSESALATRLGVARDLLRELRDEALEHGPDWGTHKRVIFYTESGVKKIEVALAQRAGMASAGPQPDAGTEPHPQAPPSAAAPITASAIPEKKPSAARAREVLVVVAVPKNPHSPVILARLKTGEVPKPGHELRVRVRHTLNFRAGMEMNCVHDQGAVWDLIGNCPRWPGRW